ncbi:MAG: hypothetical protein CM1200mP33_7320 [Chloroflexota bacterium]|nr:MAG: hypothetical protein CM1200mP33_7320 [Chloroflexota bacterium]
MQRISNLMRSKIIARGNFFTKRYYGIQMYYNIPKSTKNLNSIFTNQCNENDILNIPISHGEGLNFFANDDTPQRS